MSIKYVKQFDALHSNSRIIRYYLDGSYETKNLILKFAKVSLRFLESTHKHVLEIYTVSNRFSFHDFRGKPAGDRKAVYTITCEVKVSYLNSIRPNH